MAEIGEMVAVTEVDTDETECPFNHDKPGTVKNDLGTDPGKLGRRMTSGSSTQMWDDASGKVTKKKMPAAPQSKTDAIPEPHEADVALDHLGNSKRFPFSVAAHHLIPGDASLPESNLINYVKGGNTISSDIGYDVNGRENGIWLPTHHALSQEMQILPDATEVHAYRSLSQEGGGIVASFVTRYTQTVMDTARCQFHDDHTTATDYSDFVIRVLNKIAANLVTIESACQKCKDAKQASGKLPPPHKLVFRLNNVSARLATFLVGPPIGWRPPVFTSPHARDYAVAYYRLHARGRL
jgi:hypothetical protein